jgi:hypothetical protein
LEWCQQGRLDSQRRKTEFVVVGAVLQKYSELVAAEASDRETEGHCVGESGGDSHEQVVARRMAEAVVHLPEIIEIE